ncbi:mediator of RNA polymerase II transcription subunit 4 [Scheffersomyces coipomensis]|uniref:mediator of RNA polymerase II transcription subunit 4 n=1 Tax=Scheffersomyces coipomensis TaxID=1788519 RepID=UPI00315D1155
MIPQRKVDSSLKSPVSRISSGTRLNQLNHNHGSYSPLASTPNPHISSLNPARNLPVDSSNYKSKIKTKAELDRFEKLPIVQLVSTFEQTLNAISNDISLFKETELPIDVEKIIKINDDLHNKIEELASHRDLGKQVSKLTSENQSLDSKAKYILKELIAYRSELKSLPRLPSKRSKEVAPTIQVEEILKYGMKLAKFTKAPATMSNAPYQIHPNNYVWPAEDALRRGMLAASSLQPEAIIRNELGLDDEEVKVTATNTEKVQTSVEETRRGSFGDYGSGQDKKRKTGGAVQSSDLNLDLFDSDEEFSD